MTKHTHTKTQLSELYTFIMSKLGHFDFILFYGSLLGFIREGDFIENDDDIDVLLPFKDREKFLYTVKRLNLKITVEELTIVQIYVDNLGHFDVYFYENRGLDILLRWDGNLLYLKNDIWPLKKVIFKNYKINIPFNSEKLLNEIYGNNWRIPLHKDEYDWNNINNVRHL